ncbi:SusC/RagA family TonB-linked outer membrane protein [Pedobacter insulae]|nr:TonB-dependent receptor [Pedobacter insulae]
MQLSSTQADTARVLQKVTITVLDLGSSKLLDSVQVTLGKQAKYTTKGVVVFENNEDSVVILTKSGYGRIGKKVNTAVMTVRLMKTADAEAGYLIGMGLSQNTKSMFSGSAITVSSEELRKVNALNLVDGLKFFVPSLIVVNNNNNGGNPNTLPQISLRGASNLPYTVTANATSGVLAAPSQGDYIAAGIISNSTPVVLLDGVQVSLQTILDIDLNRVTSVTVLKDAAATASYGMRGGNGVIAVQTVRPQSKLAISFTEQVQVATANTASFKALTAKQKVDIEKNSGLFNGVLAPIYQNRYNKAYQNNINTDWLAVPLQNGVGAKHSLGLSAGNEDVVYGVNASYNDVEGSMKGSSRKTLDLGAYFGGHFGAFSFSNKFSYLGADVSNSSYGSFINYTKMNPYWELNDPYTGKPQRTVETSGEVTFLNPAYNASISTKDVMNYNRYSNFTNLNYILGSGFQLNGMVNIVHQTDELDYFLPPNHTVFGNITPENIFTRGLYNYTSNSILDVQGGLRLQHQNSFGKHQLFANVGQHIAQTSSESEGIVVAGFATDRIGDIAFGNSYATSKPVSGKIVTRYLASFANAGYSYDNRYQVDVSGSVDYYSGLNQAAKFGAVGLSWNVSNEAFLKSVKWIDLLKIKGSIGIAGNQAFLSYLTRTTYDYYTNQQYVPAGTGVGTIGLGLGNYLTSYGNKNLRAPETFKQDVGVDAAFFNNRLVLNLNLYKQLHNNLILPVSTVGSTGYQDFAYYDNYGEIANKGLEIAAMATVYQAPKNNFKINIIANALHATDEITAAGSYFNDVNNFNNTTAAQNTAQPRYVVGESPYAIWAVPSLGLDPNTGKEIFLKKDGSSTMIWDANDKVVAGSLMPEWVGSLGTDISFRKFSFGAYFNYQHGAKVYNQTMAAIENANVNENLDARALDAKRLFGSPTFATTRLVASDNKIQCSSIMLGYKFPKTFAEKINAKDLGIKLMVNNAFEVGGADIQRGIYYPFQRNYTFILNANF